MEIAFDGRQPDRAQDIAPKALDAGRRAEPDVAFAVFDNDPRRQ
jgi:hypothetical protein